MCTPTAFAAVLKSTHDLGLTVIALQKKHALVRTVVCMSSKLLTLVVLADCAGLNKPVLQHSAHVSSARAVGLEGQSSSQLFACNPAGGLPAELAKIAL